jgi:ATP-dependent Lon protease
MSGDTEFIIQHLGTGDGAPRGVAPASADHLPESLPILGLADVVVFPGMVVPLLVDTPQSTRLVDDVVAGDRLVGLVLQRKPEAQNPGPADLWTVGCAARVLKMLKFPDGSARVLVEGVWRVALKEYTAEKPYLRALVEVLPDPPSDSLEAAALFRTAQNQFQQIINLSPGLSETVKVQALNTEEPGRFADLIASNLNLGLDERQRLLEMPGARDRLKRLLPLMSRELEVLTLGSKIQSEVTTSMSKTQRDFFLREQLRAIQRELGDHEPGAAESAELKKNIEAAQLPPEVRKVALKELERLQQTPTASPEFAIIRNYLDFLTAMPWDKATEDKFDLAAAGRILDEQHFGLRKVKDRLLEFIAVIKLKKQIKGPILCLVGPPGVGKTSLGKSVADALGRKFVRIALGGMRDEAEIRGHRRTYVGAMPGRILQSLRRAESNNPVILLDEIDKVGADFRGDPASALLEVLDPQQNHTFTDHYLDLPFDLSRVLFITTANWLEPIHPALRDRLEVIELPGYTEEEKLQIARRHLVPRQLEEHGVKPKLLRFPDAGLRRLIRDYTREPGVRQLDREIAAITRKAARRLAARSDAGRPLTVSVQRLREFLGPQRFVSETAEAITDYGIAIGLAWTPVGGEILFIEATRMAGKGRLILTGSLGDVMKESAHAALSYLRSHAKQLGIDAEQFDKRDIHIHVPSGATPKDGPSAGSAIVVALTSLLLKRLVRSDVAVTGEISLRGRVLPVGGIKEKVLAAARSGIRRVVLPEQNRKDLADVPDEVRKKLDIQFVRRISELLPLALRSK